MVAVFQAHGAPTNERRLRLDRLNVCLKGAMLPFTDLSVDAALVVDGIVPHESGTAGCCDVHLPFGPIRSHNVSSGTTERPAVLMFSARDQLDAARRNLGQE